MTVLLGVLEQLLCLGDQCFLLRRIGPALPILGLAQLLHSNEKLLAQLVEARDDLILMRTARERPDIAETLVHLFQRALRRTPRLRAR